MTKMAFTILIFYIALCASPIVISSAPSAAVDANTPY
jgi:hypothetical protein